MAFTIPEELRFSCFSCRGTFVVSAVALSGRVELFCPFCGERLNWLEALDEDVRREVLVQVEEEIEELVDVLEGASGAQSDEITAERLENVLRERRRKPDGE